MSLFKPKMDPAIKAKAERPGVLVFVSVPCVSGLPVPEKTMAQVYYFEDHLEIDAGGTEYNLTLEKVQEIAIQTHVERQTQAVSSVGGCHAGSCHRRSHRGRHRRKSEGKEDPKHDVFPRGLLYRKRWRSGLYRL